MGQTVVPNVTNLACHIINVCMLERGRDRSHKCRYVTYSKELSDSFRKLTIKSCDLDSSRHSDRVALVEMEVRLAMLFSTGLMSLIKLCLVQSHCGLSYPAAFHSSFMTCILMSSMC